MSTLVNLHIGGAVPPSESETIYELILVSPYTEPGNNLLVLRSAPDITPITGTIAPIEARDAGVFTATTGLPVDPIVGTLAVTGRSDSSSFIGEGVAPGRTGTWATTEAKDTTVITGLGYEGIVPRTGTLNIAEAPDTSSVSGSWTMKWVASMAATEPGDVGEISTWYDEYTGPGFLNATERKDSTAFVGRNVYSVAGTLSATEQGDTAAISGLTAEWVEAESTDTVVVSEVLSSAEVILSLVDRCYCSDLVEEDQHTAITERVYSSDYLVSALKVTQVLAESPVVRDALFATFSGDVTDTVVVSDGSSALIGWELADRVVATGVLGAALQISAALADSITGTDVLRAMTHAVSTDTVRASETLSGQAVFSGALRDTITVHDTLAASLASSAALADRGVIQETLGYAWMASTTDTLSATEVQVGVIRQIAPALVDGVAAAITLSSTMAVYAPVLTDTGLSADAVTDVTLLRLVGVLSDTVLAGDGLQESAQTLCVVNAETGAVSTYTLTPVVTSLASFRGTLYLAGPDGLYAMDAETDGDGAVVWTVQTGFSDLGTDALKRIRDVNIQCRTAGDTTVQVTSDRCGEKQTWTYRLPPITRTAYRDGVVKIGKGIASVYYALGLQGVGPAELDQLRVVVEPLSRRR